MSYVHRVSATPGEKKNTCLTQLFRAYLLLAVCLYYVFIMVRERRNSYARAPPAVVLAGSRGREEGRKKREREKKSPRGINYPGSDYRVARRRLRGCAIIERLCCISDNNSAPSPSLPFFLLCAIFDRRRCALHRAVLGRKPLSHLITDAVVNNGDDAQEIPQSPRLFIDAAISHALRMWTIVRYPPGDTRAHGELPFPETYSTRRGRREHFPYSFKCFPVNAYHSTVSWSN